MNLGENIFNSFEIAEKTYENVNKLMSYCKATANEKGTYTLVTPKFLRYKSDNDIHGWSITSFILLFQNEEDELLENKWRDGSVYILEINLYEPEFYNVPMVNVAKYDYADISSWSKGCSPTSHWVFYNPLYLGEVLFQKNESNNSYIGIVDTEKFPDENWWGLRKITGLEIPLVEINIENAYTKIFGNFDLLKDM